MNACMISSAPMNSELLSQNKNFFHQRKKWVKKYGSLMSMFMFVRSERRNALFKPQRNNFNSQPLKTSTKTISHT